MPRVKSLDAQTKKERKVHAIIERYMIELNKEDAEVADRLNIHVQTFRRKKKKPSQFTLWEMQQLAMYLRFEERDRAACL